MEDDGVPPEAGEVPDVGAAGAEDGGDEVRGGVSPADGVVADGDAIQVGLLGGRLLGHPAEDLHPVAARAEAAALLLQHPRRPAVGLQRRHVGDHQH